MKPPLFLASSASFATVHIYILNAHIGFNTFRYLHARKRLHFTIRSDEHRARLVVLV